MRVPPDGNGHIDDPIRVAVFGLGEAGSLLAADLVAAGVDVHAYDPAARATPPGVTRHGCPANAIMDVGLVLAVTAAADAEHALRQALGHMPAGLLYADLSAASAAEKRRLGAIASEAGLAFADVAVLAPVPGRGMRAPQLVSGPGADRYVAALRPFGSPATAVGDRIGDAASRKLLRSIVTKGLAALLIEAMRGGESAGIGDWLWAHLLEELTSADQQMLQRLVTGTGAHAERRCHEMEAASELLTELGVEPVMTDSTVQSLRDVGRLGIPHVPRQHGVSPVGRP